MWHGPVVPALLLLLVLRTCRVASEDVQDAIDLKSVPGRALASCSQTEIVVAVEYPAKQLVLIEALHAVFGSNDEVLSSQIQHAVPPELCEPAAVSAYGKILIVRRGACYFSTKANYAQKAGARGVIIYDDGRGGDSFVMGCPDQYMDPNEYYNCQRVRIPSYFIWYEDAQPFLQQLNSVSVSFACPERYATPVPTQVPTAWPTAYRTLTPTSVPTPASSSPTLQPTSFPTLHPTLRPTSRPTGTPSQRPTRRPTQAPTATPTLAPSRAPTLKPTVITASPSVSPTLHPTAAPTSEPTPPPGAPTLAPTPPTFAPTHMPTTQKPTAVPTQVPTDQPTSSPSVAPTTLSPTRRPTAAPTLRPTASPTLMPTVNPTLRPTRRPTLKPTASPTLRPTWRPTARPTFAPTASPSRMPTPMPSRRPTAAPTKVPETTTTTTSRTTTLAASSTIIEATAEIHGKVFLSTPRDFVDSDSDDHIYALRSAVAQLSALPLDDVRVNVTVSLRNLFRRLQSGGIEVEATYALTVGVSWSGEVTKRLSRVSPDVLAAEISQSMVDIGHEWLPLQVDSIGEFEADCIWNPWEDWSSCNKACGGESRQRTMLSRRNASDTTPCVDPAEQSRDCPSKPDCPKCASGRYLYVNEFVYYCRSCAPGRYRELPGGVGSEDCDLCEAGSYATAYGTKKCTPCGVGRYGLVEGASSEQCYQCPKGRASADEIRAADGTHTCDLCAPGRYADTTGMTACTPCGSGYYSGLEGLRSSSYCQPCPAGTGDGPAVAASLSECPLCKPGRFAFSRGLAICTDCLPGHFSAEPGAYSCKPCTPGTYSQAHGSENCTFCSPGYYSNSNGAWLCTPCRPSTYSATFGAKQCDACERGRTVAVEGAAICDNCSAGSSSHPGSTTCYSCKSGTTSASGDPFCSPCERGRYAPSNGTQTCLACDGGQFADERGLSECDDCFPGTFSINGSANCSECDVMTFAEFYGSQSCTNCSLGSVASSPGQSKCIECPRGSYHSGGSEVECIPCPGGRYNGKVGESSCVGCPIGKYSSILGALYSTTCVTCPRGRYGNVEGLPECVGCPAGTSSTKLGATLVDECEPCQAGKFSYGNATSCSVCLPGRYSADAAPECQLCDPGYFASLGGMQSCMRCDAGRYANESGSSQCKECLSGFWREEQSPGDTCSPCDVGKFGDRAGATTAQQCVECPVGRFNDQPGRTLCILCEENSFNPDTGRSSPCQYCPRGSLTPNGATSCCPAHSDRHWPISPVGSLESLPGKSGMELYIVSDCSVAATSPYKSRVYAEGGALIVASAADNEMAVTGGSPDSCRTFRCGGSGCIITMNAERTRFAPGQSLEIVAFVQTSNSTSIANAWTALEDQVGRAYDAATQQLQHGGNRYDRCSKAAIITLVGFGCSPDTIMYFFIAMSGAVIVTILGGLLIELSQRFRRIVMVECSIEVVLPLSAPMPTRRTLRDDIARGLQLTSDDLPPGAFSTAVRRSRRDQTLHVEFGVRAAKSDHERIRQNLLQTTWMPASENLAWASAKVTVQPPILIKAAGKAPGIDLILLLERAALICLGGVEEEDHDERYLHLAVARRLIERFASRVPVMLLTLQSVSNLIAAGALPAWAFFIMQSCATGYPSSVHVVWLCYVLASSLSNILLIWLIGGPLAKPFLWKFRLRILMRVLFMSLMLTDTYQDATFPVIANTCGFDLWYVSAWLVLLGVVVMQFGAQLIALAFCVYGYWRARSPEDRERHFVQGIFLVLRGSDNLVLSYAVRPAVEERLGGASSWAMKTSEARIAFFRFLFEDVEQSALQVVFIIFYEDAALNDKLWVISSVATALLLSFTIVVQCLPEVRDWIWHRLLAALPAGTTVPFVRGLWLLACLCVYRVMSAFPWISACSPSGDTCEAGGGLSWWRSHCVEGESYLFGYPTRYEVVREVMIMSGFCVLGMSVSIACVAAVCWLLRRRRGLDPSQRRGGESYASAGRLALAAEEGGLRPLRAEDADGWLRPARQLHAFAVESGLAPELASLIEAIDRKTFFESRAHLAAGLPSARSGLMRVLRRHRELELPELAQKLLSDQALVTLGTRASSVARELVVEVHHAWRIAEVRRNTAELLASRSFVQAPLLEKAALVEEATGGFAPLQFVHWTAIEALGELPVCGSPGGAFSVKDTLRRSAARLSIPSQSQAAECLVPFFVSHRWLRTKGPPSEHHPDSERNTKAKLLVSFARWFETLAKQRGLRCDVVFWIDWCCRDQLDPKRSEVATAALPLYIAACSRVLAWRSADFENRCWTMVERVLAYSFCPGGMAPYVIDESFGLDGEEAGVADAGAAGLSTEDLECLVEDDVVSVEESAVKVTESHIREASGPSSPHSGAPAEPDTSFGVAIPEPAVEPVPAAPTVVKEDDKELAAPLEERTDPLMLYGHIVVTRRARKLPNPLDFEACQVSRQSDRMLVAHLVDLALAVPALEVFADRQPVEWGLTEVVEQLLVQRNPLPTRLAVDHAGAWLRPVQRPPPAQWRLVVRRAGDPTTATTLQETAAVIWLDSGRNVEAPVGTPPTRDELEALFIYAEPALLAAADGAVDEDGSGEAAIRALLLGLKACLRTALAAGDAKKIAMAVAHARDVELPERQAAIDHLCRDRLETALASGNESAMRGALGVARASGSSHLPIYSDVLREQTRLYEAQLKEKLEQQLDLAIADGDVASLDAIRSVCDRYYFVELQAAVAMGALGFVARFRASKNPRELLELERCARQAGWLDLASDAKFAAEDASMMLALDAAAEGNNLSVLRAIEARAGTEHRTEIAAMAAEAIKSCASRIGDQLGLPAEWDVVLSMAGPTAALTGLLKKTEETEAALVDLLQKLVDDTYMGWGGLGKATRTRDRASEAIADRLVVKSVVHVQNAENYVNFRARRAAVRAECPDGMRTEWSVKTTKLNLAGHGRHHTNPVDPSINEYYLWHGTSPAAAAAITDSDFELKRAGTVYGSLFGAGLYFAESCMKADEYTKPDARDWRPLILCRVVMGNIMYCDARDPVPIRADLEAACAPGGPGFHSVLGDREKVRKTFREFVVYDNHQVYPEYIVWYKRTF